MDDQPGRAKRALAALRRLDSGERLVALARAGRRRLPGDHEYGDPLSLAGDEAPQVVGRGLSALADERPSALRELGMGALQVWQGLSEAQGRGHGDRELAILFTDLVDFSDWVLEAGDERAVELVRAVGQAVEDAVRAHGGRVVKRLGDGVMAVFDDPAAAVRAGCEAAGAAGELHAPGLRAGVHIGRPRKLGGDYFGVDVNVAARVGAAARAGEVLVTAETCEQLPAEAFEIGRGRKLKAEGVPKGLQVRAVMASA